MIRARLPVLATTSAAVVLLLALAVAVGSHPPADPGRQAVTLTPEPPSLYAGTPAESFAAGAAGVTLPPARELPAAHLLTHHPTRGPVTVEEAREILAAARAALIATRLDPVVLIEHDPDPYLDSQSPWTRQQWAPPTGQAQSGFLEPGWAVMWATKLAEGVTLAAPPRSAATATYEATTIVWGAPADPLHHVVEVHTEGVWVYALAAPGVPDPALVVVRDEQVWDWPTDYRVLSIESNHGLHHRRWEGQTRVWGVDCELYEEAGLIRPAPGVDQSEVPPAAWDLTAPLPPAGGCTPPDPPDPRQR